MTPIPLRARCMYRLTAPIRTSTVRTALRSKRLFSSVSYLRQDATSVKSGPVQTDDFSIAKYASRFPKYTVEDIKKLSPRFLRDCCTCPACVDSSSSQKKFSTTSIPENIKYRTININQSKVVRITWENDIAGFNIHTSTYSPEFFSKNVSTQSVRESRMLSPPQSCWTTKTITNDLEYIDYKSYMSDDEALYRAAYLINFYGLMFLRGVPKDPKAVEAIASRIGTIRDTFYGRTWDVKTVEGAKNVAYTDQSLVLHQDLLYMKNPPGLQLLHCLENTVEGGNSRFADGFSAFHQFSKEEVEVLSQNPLAYHYHNDGQHYFEERPVFELATGRAKGINPDTLYVQAVNFSPQFQAPQNSHSFRSQYKLWPLVTKFKNRIEHRSRALEYRLQEGECVIMNNRRVLHGRTKFTSETGSRWLRGTYIDTDVFQSRLRVLKEQFPVKKFIYGDPEAKFMFDQDRKRRAGKLDEDRRLVSLPWYSAEEAEGTV